MITRKRQRIALLIAASLGSIAAAAASANAAEGSTGFTVHAHAQAFAGRTVLASGRAVASRTVGVGARPAAALPDIYCEVVADPPVQVPAGDPFGGQTKPYNGIGSATFATCTGIVNRISLTSAMLYNGGSEVFGPPVTTNYQATADGAVLTFCAPGDWQPGAAATIVMPVGYQPRTLQLADTPGIYNFTEYDCNPGLP